MVSKGFLIAESVRAKLQDAGQLARQVETAAHVWTGGLVAISWDLLVKRELKEHVDSGEEFVLLLSVWMKRQREDDHIRPGNKGKSTEMLLAERFGTEQLSSLEVEEIRDQGVFREMEAYLIGDDTEERYRARELKSMRHAAGAAIKCKTGDILYFGQTPMFSFLINRAYMARTPHVFHDIREILFGGEMRESVRKRPGVYIGSMSRNELNHLVCSLVESMLNDAEEKVISLRLCQDHIVEIVCESYRVENNTSYFNNLGVASALGEFFEYQDENQFIRTEQGIMISEDLKHTVASGTKIIWKADGSLFPDMDFDYLIILNRMVELAALNPYTIYLEYKENRNKIQIPSGIGYFLKRNCTQFEPGRILYVDIAGEQFTGKAALSFSVFQADIRKSYVNSQITLEGGTHVDGLLTGVRRALKRILDDYGNKLKPGQLLRHLNYAVHVQIENPRFHGATKNRLKNIEVKPAVEKQVEEQVYAFLTKDIWPLKAIYYHLF